MSGRIAWHQARVHRELPAREEAEQLLLALRERDDGRLTRQQLKRLLHVRREYRPAWHREAVALPLVALMLPRL